MASQKEMYEVLGHALADAEFRAALMADPVKAVKEAGYKLTEEQMAMLKKTDFSALSEGLGERLSKGWAA
jgi:Ribosomally synthesized peptide prototyped by Frankia Franean1_4349.